METLNKIRSLTRTENLKFDTIGLNDDIIESFISDDKLIRALENSLNKLSELRDDQFYSKILQLDEDKQIKYIQKDILNFYEEKYINPYVPLSSYGPWIITTFGSVIYDVGGYGMLSLGHNPDIIENLSEKQTMTNIMTAQFIHAKYTSLLDHEIGSKFSSDDQGHCAIYDKYIFLNSGSEAMALATRLANTLEHSNNLERYTVSLKGSFHGRLDLAAKASGSSRTNYVKHLASFQEKDRNIFIRANNIEDLLEVFNRDIFIDCLILEPVIGEGSPGLALTKEFYERARLLTKERGTLLIIDSVQAGLRANGHLSVIDYFNEKVMEPDIEVFSKAINAGQCALSILALSKTATNLYKYGIYGNTMTANPRALELSSKVLEIMSDKEIKQNIQEMGLDFLLMLKKLEQNKIKIVSCQGTGLLLSLKISDEYDIASIERSFRLKGLGLIHGSDNSLRFTPNFYIKEAEIDMIYNLLRDFL